MPISTPRRGGARGALLALLAIAALAACSAGEKKAQVTYYYMPNIPESTARIEEVKALEQEFSGKVTVRTVDASADAAKRELSRFEVGSQGIVLQDYRGVLMYKFGGNKFRLDEVRAELAKLGGK
jgi:ABC-type glycerol-3-phosphate transport system substrate-binding protein